MADAINFSSLPIFADTFPEEKKENKVYSVSELIDTVNDMVGSVEYVVQGEISRVSEKGGHYYFTLCDKKESAVINCIIWAFKFRKVGITLTDGMEVQIKGKLQLYKPNGRISLIADQIIPVGEGALKQAYEALKKHLEEEGYFNPQRKRFIPLYPQSIGLITSFGREAHKDFVTHLGNHGIKITFYDVRVEGIRSIDSIVKALRYFNEHLSDIEVLVLTRGGGSLESLAAFNSQEVAKAIYSSRIPVISAVGHENDVTIADLVADIRASTPTHAGKILSEYWNRVEEQINDIEQQIYSLFRMKTDELQERVATIEENLLVMFKKSIELNTHRINSIDRSLTSCFSNMLHEFKHITQRYSFSFQQFTTKYSEVKNIIRQTELYLHDNMLRWYKSLERRIGENERGLQLSDPQLKLKQGYSITRNQQGLVLKSSDKVAIEEEITVQLYSGKITANVNNLK